MLTVRRFRVLQRLVRSASTLPATPSAQTAGVVAEVPQSHNRATIWSDSQRIRPAPHSGPRFEQIEQSLQPNPASAIELIAQVPVIMTEARKAACDGGGGPLGHPKVFINLDKPGSHACGYCGLRFEQAPHHH